MSQNQTHPAIKILERHKKIVWPEIKKYLKDPVYPKAFTVPKKYKKEAEFHWTTVKEYPKRKGKYLRPTLLILSADSMGVPTNKSLKSAAAMQLSEEWMLGHDDFEDNSLMRRGKLAIHRLYGPEIAVNAGDHLHAIMWKIIRDNIGILDTKTAVLILDEFYRMLSRTAMGQGIEIAWTKSETTNFTDDQWYFVADGKTSYYTIALPMRLGAILGGANSKQLETLAKFGINLGRCFQLVDDILDVTSDFKGRKQKANDIYEGKRTIILGHLLRKSKKNDKANILKILAKARDHKSEKEVEWVVNKMYEYGSVDYAKILAHKFKLKAEEIFEKDLKFLSKQPYRNQLKTLIDFIVEREY